MPPWGLMGAPAHVLVEAPCSVLAVDTVPNDYAQPVEALSSALVRRLEDWLDAGSSHLLLPPFCTCLLTSRSSLFFVCL